MAEDINVHRNKMRDFQRDLLHRTWRFSQEGGKMLSPGLRLQRDGRIGNYQHRNEYAWRLSKDVLEFLRQDGTVSTRFDEVHYLSNPGEHPRSLRLRGKILLDRDETAGFHILEANPPLWARGRPLKQHPKVAVLIRTHVANEKLYHLIDCLQGSPFFDLYVLADETRNPLPIIGTCVLPHSVKMCASLGLKTDPANHFSVLWLCGDYPLYCASRMLADYEFYAMIEYDVHFVRESPLFLEGIINRLGTDDGGRLDFVCTRIKLDEPTGTWYPAAARIYEKVYWSGIFSLIIVSKKALNYLLNARLAEGANPVTRGELIHCEAFALTALMNAGTFQCTTLDELVPGCMVAKTYHANGLDPFHIPIYLLGARVEDDPRVELVHPVLDAESYLASFWKYCKENNKIREFIKHVDGLNPALVTPDLKENFLTNAQKLAG